jgi:hypothetical protein
MIWPDERFGNPQLLGVISPLASGVHHYSLNILVLIHYESLMAHSEGGPDRIDPPFAAGLDRADLDSARLLLGGILLGLHRSYGGEKVTMIVW